MSCNFTEKVSLLIDAELGPEEAERTRQHIAACYICRQAQEDFLRLRQEIRAYSVAPATLTQKAAPGNIIALRNPPLWKRRVSLPAPVFALLLIALVTLGVFSIAMRRNEVPAARQVRKGMVLPPASPSPPVGLDLARFDHGERAVIYTAHRTDTGPIKP